MKTEISTVVLATDLFPTSTQTLSFAISLSRKLGAQLVIVTALELGYDALNVELLDHRPSCTRMKAEERIRSYIAESERAGVQTSSVLLDGPVPGVILDAVSKFKADLVVLGTPHVPKRLEHFLVGSNTEALILHSPCPTVIIGRWMLVFGFTVAGLSFFGYSHMSLQSGIWDIFWIQITQGAGLAFLFVPLTTLTMGSVFKMETGYATSLYNTMRNIGSSIGISFVTTLVARRSQFHQDVLSANLSASSLIDQKTVAGLIPFLQQSGLNAANAGQKANGLIYQMLLQQASLLSYMDVFHLMGILFLAIIPMVLLLRRPEHLRPRKPNH